MQRRHRPWHRNWLTSYIEEKRARIDRCKNCGLIRLRPVPDHKKKEAYDADKESVEKDLLNSALLGDIGKSLATEPTNAALLCAGIEINVENLTKFSIGPATVAFY